MKILVVYLIVINTAGLILFGADKSAAKNHKWRIPEQTLMIIAALGGALGCLLGMFGFHHKTKHMKFRIGIPLILICWVVLLLFILLR